MLAVAVNETGVPVHTVVLAVAILIVGVTTVLTVIVSAFDVTLLLVAQADDDVNTQVTISLLASVVIVKVALLVPALLPFTFHW